jgi:hypothetical protein
VLFTRQDVRLMQGLAQQVFALRPELINDDASVGELAWVWGKDHAALGDTWRWRLWRDGSGAVVAWGWAYLPYRIGRSDGGVLEVPYAYLAWQVHPDRPELLDEILHWYAAECGAAQAAGAGLRAASLRAPGRDHGLDRDHVVGRGKPDRRVRAGRHAPGLPSARLWPGAAKP